MLDLDLGGTPEGGFHIRLVPAREGVASPSRLKLGEPAELIALLSATNLGCVSCVANFYKMTNKASRDRSVETTL